jgi:ATP-binding cassette subfamily C protein CydCD
MALPPVFAPTRRRRALGLVALGLVQALLGVGLVRASTVLASAEAAERAGFAPALLALALALGVTLVVQARLADALALDYVGEVRGKLLQSALLRPFDQPAPALGPVMSRAVSDLSALRSWLASGLAAGLVALVTLVGLGLGFAVLAPDLLRAAVPALLLFALVGLVVLVPLRRAVREARHERGRLARLIGEVVPARATFLLHGQAGPIDRRVARCSARLAAALLRRTTQAALLRATGLAAAPLVLLTGLLGPGVAAPATLGAADTAGLLLAGGLVGSQLVTLARAFELKLAEHEARRRLATLLRQPILARREAAPPLTRRRRGPRLELRDLRTRPDGIATTLRLERGEVVLLRCACSDERRRLALVVAGLAEPAAGRLRLGDRPHDAVRRRDWWRQVTLIGPEVPLLGRPVVEEAGLGAPPATGAAELARVLETVGLDPAAPLPIGDAARVRLRVARALLRGAGLLVVDDPDLLERREVASVLLDAARARGASLLLLADHAPAGLAVDRIEDSTPTPLRAAG